MGKALEVEHASTFHAFSGLGPTHYSAANRPWANHIPLD
jgi:hypothetical protein